jgi:transposase-like protein
LWGEVERVGSVVEVARRRGVNERTLAWWCWKLRGERMSAPPSAAEPRLLPVVVREARPEVRGERPLVLEVAAVRVHVAVGTDVAYVAALAGALRGC